MLFSLALDGLKFNGAYHLVFSVKVNIFGESVHTMKKNTGAVVVAGKEIGLEVRTDKTKYTVISRDQNAGRRHKIKIDNSSF